MTRRVVFDRTTVVSALLFRNGRLTWLRQHWRQSGCVPLMSRTTAAELMRVLGYPKFALTTDDRRELLAEYLPYCEVIESRRKMRGRVPRCKRPSFPGSGPGRQSGSANKRR